MNKLNRSRKKLKKAINEMKQGKPKSGKSGEKLQS